MVVQRYFYVNIDPIARQVVASRMMELTGTTVFNHCMEGQFQFLAF